VIKISELMPIKQSAKKELRKTKKRNALNLIIKNAYKTAVKDVRKAVDAGEKELTEKIKGAMLYPIVVLIATFCLGLAISFFVLPQITPLKI